MSGPVAVELFPPHWSPTATISNTITDGTDPAQGYLSAYNLQVPAPLFADPVAKRAGVGTSAPNAVFEAVSASDGTPAFRASRYNSAQQALEINFSSTGNLLTSYSYASNAKEVFYDCRTDANATTPTSGALGHYWLVNGARQLRLGTSGLVPFNNKVLPLGAVGQAWSMIYTGGLADSAGNVVVDGSRLLYKPTFTRQTLPTASSSIEGGHARVTNPATGKSQGVHVSGGAWIYDGDSSAVALS